MAEVGPAIMGRMSAESRHVGERIDRPADEVYEYVVDPANIPEWAPGLGSGVENVDGRWFVDTSMGRVGVAFADRNAFGVLRPRSLEANPGGPFAQARARRHAPALAFRSGGGTSP